MSILRKNFHRRGRRARRGEEQTRQALPAVAGLGEAGDTRRHRRRLQRAPNLRPVSKRHRSAPAEQETGVRTPKEGTRRSRTLIHALPIALAPVAVAPGIGKTFPDCELRNSAKYVWCPRNWMSPELDAVPV